MSPQDIGVWAKKILILLEKTFKSVYKASLVPISVRSWPCGASHVLIKCMLLYTVNLSVS